MEEIKVTDNDFKWVQDPKGYFTIKPFFDENVVKVRYYTIDNQLKYTFSGNPTNIIHKIISMGLVSRMDHVAYLGRELEKAQIALENGLSYIQDDKLNL